MILPTHSAPLVVDQAAAFELAEKLENVKRHDTGKGTTIFQGDDPMFGLVYIVIANAINEAIILPFASQLASF